MNMLSRNWMPDAIGACALVAGLALLGVVLASGDAIGTSVGAVMGAGFVAGVIGCIGKQALTSLKAPRRPTPETSHVPALPTLVAMPPAADATASEYDEREQTSFAPVVSLTEAQVERQRERQRDTRRATPNRA